MGILEYLFFGGEKEETPRLFDPKFSEEEGRRFIKLRLEVLSDRVVCEKLGIDYANPFKNADETNQAIYLYGGFTR